MTWNNNKTGLLLIVFLMLGSSVSSWAQSLQEPDVSLPNLRLQLLERMELDQKARRAVMDSMARSIQGQPDSQLVEDMLDTNEANKLWLARQLDGNPWFRISEVGKDGAHAAWIIVQHSDHDRRFQSESLNKMRKMYDVTPREIDIVDLAYLTDRVLVAQNKPQRYGTQVMIRDGEFKPVQMENPEELDSRREALGLQSMANYLFALRQNYARSRGNTANR